MANTFIITCYGKTNTYPEKQKKKGSSGIWSDGYCEWYIDNLYALCVTICILACSYASTHLNTIEPFVGANYSF